ncbi:MAG TPA: hypothetical protein VMT18_03210, partial [Planctomycetota bacterium]|nr:hypothetical protein [Planctomycetota bacterium]
MPSRTRAALAGLALALVAGVGVLAWVALDGETPPPAVKARAEVERAAQRRAEAGEVSDPDVASDGTSEPAAALEPRVALSAEVLEQSEPWGGTVEDVASGGGIDGAEVELAAGERVRAVRTDERGRFELAWPSDVPARLAIRHPRY